MAARRAPSAGRSDCLCCVMPRPARGPRCAALAAARPILATNQTAAGKCLLRDSVPFPMATVRVPAAAISGAAGKTAEAAISGAAGTLRREAATSGAVATSEAAISGAAGMLRRETVASGAVAITAAVTSGAAGSHRAEAATSGAVATAALAHSGAAQNRSRCRPRAIHSGALSSDADAASPVYYFRFRPCLPLAR